MADPQHGEDSPIIPAVKYLQSRIPFRPSVTLVLGSGLGRIADYCMSSLTLSYAEIPGFPRCSVEGHAGRLHVGTWQGVPLAVLEGRAHRYEGHTLEEVTRPIRTVAALGSQALITTCAAGALDNAAPGTLFLIDDHVNLMGDNPLLSMRDRCAESPPFLEMAETYDDEMRAVTVLAARESGIVLHRGVMACVPGPTYETAAEAEMLRRLGAHAVNMSVVPEVISARASEQRVLGLAVLTNRSGQPMGASASHKEVTKIAENACKGMVCLLAGVFRASQLDRNSGALL